MTSRATCLLPQSALLMTWSHLRRPSSGGRAYYDLFSGYDQIGLHTSSGDIRHRVVAAVACVALLSLVVALLLVVILLQYLARTLLAVVVAVRRHGFGQGIKVPTRNRSE